MEQLENFIFQSLYEKLPSHFNFNVSKRVYMNTSTSVSTYFPTFMGEKIVSKRHCGEK
jgi:hypothetical protein